MRTLLITLFMLAGCAAGRPIGADTTWADGEWRPFAPSATAREIPKDQPDGAPLQVAAGARDATVQAARAQLGKPHVDGKGYPDDCSGLVRSAFARAGVDLLQAAQPGDNAVTAIYRFAQRYGRIYTGGRPVEGDLVFFRDTYDLNRDGRENDGLTHVAVVDEIEDDGTVLVIHRVQGGVRRYRMNLGFKEQSKSPAGRPVNDWLRAGGKGGKPQLTSELFTAFATVLPIEPKFTAQR